jgi:hypothetical protein
VVSTFPWWDELQELFARRGDILRGAGMPVPEATAEQCARTAAFRLLFHGDHIIGNYVAALRAGANVRLELGCHPYGRECVDFDIRVAERDADPTPEGLA